MIATAAAEPAFAREAFATFLAEGPVRLAVTGGCLSPALAEGETVTLVGPDRRRPRFGDVVLCETSAGLRLHRLVWSPPWGLGWRTKGDRARSCDGRIHPRQVLGTAVAGAGRPLGPRRWLALRSLGAAVLHRILPAT